MNTRCTGRRQAFSVAWTATYISDLRKHLLLWYYLHSIFFCSLPSVLRRKINPGSIELIYFVLHMFNPFKPEFTIVNFMHPKPRIAVAILYL